VEAPRVEGEIFSEHGAPSHIQRAHPPQQIIGNFERNQVWTLVEPPNDVNVIGTK
jgi:hypothetical protein